MKDTTTNVLELLRSQHDEVDELIEDIKNSDDLDEQAALFAELADKIAAHATVEEKLFYPSAMTDETREQLIEATEEHLMVRRVIADMLELSPDDEHFDAKLTVLKDLFEHHAREEEEGKLFPIVERLMSEDELAALGSELLAMYEMLLEREPRKEIPAQTSEAVELVTM